MKLISRRDFLKITGSVATSLLTPKSLAQWDIQGGEKPNIIIVLCDALSAAHMSLYGYPRATTPNINALANVSTVYHNHYSAGNFTTTGTASMLTGMLPWKHRAINYGGLVRSNAVYSNPYTLLGSEYNRFAFSQNVWSKYLLDQYSRDIDRFLSIYDYSLLKDKNRSLLDLFRNDAAISSIAINDFLTPIAKDDPVGASILGYLERAKFLEIDTHTMESYRGGLPHAMDRIPYRNEEVFFGIYAELLKLKEEQNPYFAYFHLWSPHSPYKPRNDFRNHFKNDGYKPALKPAHPYAPGFNDEYLSARRIVYDRQIAQLDSEFGKLIQKLAEDGILQNSYLIFTSDHGELFERGYVGHGNRLMYEPVIHIPLIIRAPGQTTREDIYSPTSNIDILPTILSIAGKESNGDMDGKVLPGLGGQLDEDRAIYSIHAIENPAFQPIKNAVITMRKRAYKLFVNLKDEVTDPIFELYDLENDPEEMNDLSAKDDKLLSVMKTELFSELDKANQEFGKK